MFRLAAHGLDTGCRVRWRGDDPTTCLYIVARRDAIRKNTSQRRPHSLWAQHHHKLKGTVISFVRDSPTEGLLRGAGMAHALSPNLKWASGPPNAQLNRGPERATRAAKCKGGGRHAKRVHAQVINPKVVSIGRSLDCVLSPTRSRSGLGGRPKPGPQLKPTANQRGHAPASTRPLGHDDEMAAAVEGSNVPD